MAGHQSGGSADPVSRDLGHPPQGQLKIGRAGLGDGHIGGGTEIGLEGIGLAGRNHPGPQAGGGDRPVQDRFEALQSRRHEHLEAGPAALELSRRRHHRRQQVAQFLGAGGGQEQEHRGRGGQLQAPSGLLPLRTMVDGVDQGMAHPGDGGPMGGIEPRLFREDRQDAVGEADQAGGAAVPHPPGPLLGSDVIGDRHPRIAALEAKPQIDVGPHVVDQHHAIGRVIGQPAPQPGLQLQGGQHQGQRLPEADGPEAGGVGQQLGTGGLHPPAAQGHHLQGKVATVGLKVQGPDQQAALQITGHLTGAHQQAHHQRGGGRGPRRPGPTEASKKSQSSAAAGSKGCRRASTRASANTRSLR